MPIFSSNVTNLGGILIASCGDKDYDGNGASIKSTLSKQYSIKGALNGGI